MAYDPFSGPKFGTEGVGTGKAGGYVGSDTPPSIAQVRKLNHLVFEFKQASKAVPNFESAVQNALVTIRTTILPGWTVDYKFVP